MGRTKCSQKWVFEHLDQRSFLGYMLQGRKEDVRYEFTLSTGWSAEPGGPSPPVRRHSEGSCGPLEFKEHIADSEPPHIWRHLMDLSAQLQRGKKPLYKKPTLLCKASGKMLSPGPKGGCWSQMACLRCRGIASSDGEIDVFEFLQVLWIERDELSNFPIQPRWRTATSTMLGEKPTLDAEHTN